MAKRKLSQDELGAMLGITEADKAEGFHPVQPALRDASVKKGKISGAEEISRFSQMEVGAPDKQVEGKIRSAVDRFDNAKTTGEKNIHRKTAWDLAEGMRYDSGESGGRRTRATFVPGLSMPCANDSCHNKVPYEGPKVEAEGSPVTAGITTCSGGKCNIPGAEAPTRSRE